MADSQTYYYFITSSLVVSLLLTIFHKNAVILTVDSFSNKVAFALQKNNNSPFEITSSTLLFSTTATGPRGPSKVSDPSGPTPPNEPVEYPSVKLEDLPEANYDENTVPIPHQQWRRGETNGCEDPLDAPWRKEAERIIELAVLSAGGTYIDTTWYLTSVCVTIGMDFQDMEQDLIKGSGPEIRVHTSSAPIYYDPDDPNPDDIDFDEDINKPIYEYDFEAERTLELNSYAKADKEAGESDDPESLGLDPKDDVPLYVDKEYREDLGLRASELRKLRGTTLDDPVEMEDLFWLEKNGPIHKQYYGKKINTQALSVIANSILEALKEYDDKLNVLPRHEVVLASPSGPVAVDTQKRFDAAIGRRVAVRTHDPWQSNRSLYGILVGRSTLDVYINQKGNLVTIPNNFVSGVELMDGEELDEYEQELNEEFIEEERIEKEEHAELMKQRLADFEEELQRIEEEYDKEMEEIDKLRGDDDNAENDDDNDDEDYGEGFEKEEAD